MREKQMQTYFNTFDHPIAWHGEHLVRVWRYNVDRTVATVVYAASNLVMPVPVKDLEFVKVEEPLYVGALRAY